MFARLAGVALGMLAALRQAAAADAGVTRGDVSVAAECLYLDAWRGREADAARQPAGLLLEFRDGKIVDSRPSFDGSALPPTIGVVAVS
jgi:hypothetical protein